MNKKQISLVFALVFSLFIITNVSAIIVNDISSDIIYPGQQGQLSITLKNDLDINIKDVSVSLDLSNTGFSTVGSSEDNIDEINDGDKETFSFTLIANTNTKPGDYNIPYSISYTNGTTKKGTVGIKVRANTNLDFSASLDNPIIGESSKLNIKLINKGLADIKFVSIELEPSGYTLLSEKKIYIGTISSDDYESANFNIIIKSKNPEVVATITYRDLDDNEKTADMDLQLKAYTQEEAISLGLKQKSNAPMIIGVVIVLAIIFFVYRFFKKRAKKNKAIVNGKQ